MGSSFWSCLVTILNLPKGGSSSLLLFFFFVDLFLLAFFFYDLHFSFFGAADDEEELLLEESDHDELLEDDDLFLFRLALPFFVWGEILRLPLEIFFTLPCLTFSLSERKDSLWLPDGEIFPISFDFSITTRKLNGGLRLACRNVSEMR